MKQIGLLATVELCAALVLLRLAPIRRLQSHRRTPRRTKSRPASAYPLVVMRLRWRRMSRRRRRDRHRSFLCPERTD